MFDPKKAARIGIKLLKQKEKSREIKKRISFWEEEDESDDLEQEQDLEQDLEK